MTICKISIPFDTRTQCGTVDISVLSKDQFLKNAERIGSVSSAIFKQARHLARVASYLLLPSGTNLSQFTELKNGGLKIVKSNDSLWLGFIPFCKPKAQQQKVNPVSQQMPFWHYRLGDFSQPPKRTNAQASTACLFSLPPEFQLSQMSSDQFCSIFNLSFLLLFYQGRCALVYCEGPLPVASCVPAFCCKNEPEVQSSQPVETGSLAVPFLMGKQSGIFYVPICSLSQWIKNKKETPCKQKFLIKHNYTYLSSTLFVFPRWVTFNATLGLQGLNCYILQNQYGLEIGFFPEQNSEIQDCRLISALQPALFEAVPDKAKNCYISGKGCSSVVLDDSICLRVEKSSNTVTLKEGSFFLLASEDGHLCGLFCRRGNFELKCVKPTNPEEGYFPIEMLSEQPFPESPSAKKTRIEEEIREASQNAIEESRREKKDRKTVEEAKKKVNVAREKIAINRKAVEEARKAQLEERGESFQSSMEESRREKKGRKTVEEARKAVEAAREKIAANRKEIEEARRAQVEEREESSQSAMKKSRKEEKKAEKR